MWSVECSGLSVECRVRRSIAPATKMTLDTFDHVCRHMRMSRTPTPVTQNHVTTGFETLKQDTVGFAASPIDTARPQGKPETGDETCWSIKTSISCETSSDFHTL